MPGESTAPDSPRRALREALFAYGIRHLNGRAFRSLMEQKWHDASAKALGEGYRDYTLPVGISGTIHEMDYQLLEPGDLAVTTNGLHVLVYLGNGLWTQADPEKGRVHSAHGRSETSFWFKTPVSIHRWNHLVRSKPN